LVMKGIEQRTETRIQLRNLNIGESKVVITGTPEQVELAAKEINEIIEAAEEGAPQRRRGGFREQQDRDQSEAVDGDEAALDKRPVFPPGLRQKIWDAYKSDPERWTPKELCEHFQISPDHLKGIMVIMKHRDEYLQTNKDDEQLTAKTLEEQVVKKVGEGTFSLPDLERPVCKSHFRFLPLDAEVEEPRFASLEDELEYNRKKYEERRKQVAVGDRPVPRRLLSPLEVKTVDKFQVVFQQ